MIMSNQVKETGENDGFAGAKTRINDQGWKERAPISDRECVRICLHNSISLCGVDKEQVKRLYIKYGGKKVL